MRVRRDVPMLLQSLHTDEYAPRPPSDEVVAAVHRSRELAGDAPEDDPDHWAGRLGTAAALLAVNEQFGSRFYEVPAEAAVDREAAEEALGGDETVIDVQTHYLAERMGNTAQHLVPIYREAMPDWWKGLDDLASYNFAEYLRCVFIEAETAVAVLTSAPGRGSHRQLFNDEIAATRRLLDELGPRGRLLNHAIVHPNFDDELESMEGWAAEYRPVGWKVYTMGEPDLTPGVYEGRWGPDPSWADKLSGVWKEGWTLDDPIGRRFLDRVRELGRVGGPMTVCAHKGLSGLAETASPSDLGPASVDYPDIDFVAYHSGYEMHGDPEGPYSEAVAHLGTNRMVKSLLDSGVAPGSNVYAELGTTWFLVAARPHEAAHVLGKLLVAVGEDNVVWGTDGIYYGPGQQLIDAFRAFQIPVEMQEEFGYPALEPAIKEKILSTNAAKVYGIDLEQARRNAENDDLAWIREAADHYRRSGTPQW